MLQACHVDGAEDEHRPPLCTLQLIYRCRVAHRAWLLATMQGRSQWWEVSGLYVGCGEHDMRWWTTDSWAARGQKQPWHQPSRRRKPPSVASKDQSRGSAKHSAPLILFMARSMGRSSRVPSGLSSELISAKSLPIELSFGLQIICSPMRLQLQRILLIGRHPSTASRVFPRFSLTPA